MILGCITDEQIAEHLILSKTMVQCYLMLFVFPIYKEPWPTSDAAIEFALNNLHPVDFAL